MLRLGLLPLLPVLAMTSVAGSPPEALVLEDFSSDPGWRPIHDVVMGGRSSGGLDVREGVGIFQGRVSLENGGGFASVRSPESTVDLGKAEALEIRIRGDGRMYSLRLRDETGFDGVNHEVRFRAPDEWQILRFDFGELTPVFRGRTLRGHPPLDRSRVRTIGLLIGQKQEGPFRLEVDWIRATAGTGG